MGSLKVPSYAERGIFKILWLYSLAAFVLATPVCAQVPAVPIPSDQPAVESGIVDAIQSKKVGAYETLLASDLKVYEDGRLIASSRADWLKSLGKMLSTDGVVFKVPQTFRASGRLLTIEYFNSAASCKGEVPKHCCWRYDAVAYDIRDGKVTSIYRIKGGNKE